MLGQNKGSGTKAARASIVRRMRKPFDTAASNPRKPFNGDLTESVDDLTDGEKDAIQWLSKKWPQYIRVAKKANLLTTK